VFCPSCRGGNTRRIVGFIGRARLFAAMGCRHQAGKNGYFGKKGACLLVQRRNAACERQS
jgi:hypothetical protein